MLRLALRMLGADRYSVLMKYLSYISALMNQSDVFTSEIALAAKKMAKPRVV
jgi:hypothetical protein